MIKAQSGRWFIQAAIYLIPILYLGLHDNFFIHKSKDSQKGAKDRQDNLHDCKRQGN